jgi:hypothetical protein
MALDHYVSQVHLKNWNSSILGERMYAIRKLDLKTFQPNSKSVCRIEEGSTNAYLSEDRAIEDFLRSVEPRYNASLAKFRQGTPDADAVLAIAGFAAYVGSCSPAAMRIHSEPLENLIQTTAELLDRRGRIPKAPPGLGGKSISELLEDGTVRSNVDPKFPQAIGISTVTGRTWIFGNSHWEILRNGTDSPFFTSDYPLALEAVPRRRVPNWIVPLAPDLAVRILPDIALSGRQPDGTFSRFTSEVRDIRGDEARACNRLIVRCAEELIFYRDNRSWIEAFVAKNRAYKVEAVTDRIPV